MNIRTFCVALIVLSPHGSAEAQPLPNPFARPAAIRATASEDHETSLPPSPSPSLELRATLVRGRQSSANIGGSIVRIGAKIGDYRLMSVHEGAAVLADAAGVIRVLEIEPPRQITP